MINRITGILLSALLLLGCGLPASAETVAAYGPPRNPAYRPMADAFRRAQMLEGMARVVDGNVRMPGRLVVAMAECGTPNAYYRRDRRAVVLCYELLDDIGRGIAADFQGRPVEQVADVTAGALFFVLFHEVGHALVDILGVPVLGKEEDAADAISTYLILRHPQASSGIAGAAWFFRDKGTAYTTRQFGNEHALDPQRQLNIACWAFGRDPTAFGALARELDLPEARARRCGDEYLKLHASMKNLLRGHLR